MERLKSDRVKWTLVLVLTVFSQYVFSLPQLNTTLDVVSNIGAEKSTVDPLRNASEIVTEESKNEGLVDASSPAPNTSRDVKNKIPAIGDSIKKVATQLLDKPNKTVEVPVVPDTRIPPKVKTQFVQKLKVKTRNEDADVILENSHTGIAVPVTMEELELENKDLTNESSTTKEGISTWILLSNPTNVDNNSASTEPTQAEEAQKKQKPTAPKNKNKRPQNKTPVAKRPIIGSTNKADLVAGGSAINENVYNKIKDTVLSNVQKHKNAPSRTTTVTTTTTTTTPAPSTEAPTTKATVSIPIIKVTSKPKKTNKNKLKTSTTTTTTTTIKPIPVVSESAVLPMEAKEQEIELEISTPATTTKKPKRTSNRKKTKTKKRKTSKPKPEVSTAVSTDVKTANKTKTNKHSKKPATSVGPFTSQIYNYFSREVMPSVGVGVIGLAGLVGLASYFLYPFASPVRRTIEVDKKDDIYRHNAEEYGSEGNGQPEEEMLGTVLAGMPVHAKQKLNPYAGQMAYVNRYPVKNEQDLRYRHVANNYETNHNTRYPQQKTGIAHGAIYPDPYNYNRYQYETRHAYTTEKKYEKAQSYSPYPAVEPIYAAPEAESSGISSYGNDASSAVVYGVKPSEDSDFRPVYPYETQYQSETTSNPNVATYSPTSMYLGSNDGREDEEINNGKYSDENNGDNEVVDNKFVVGNVPKELTESATPVVVPEHGPRKLSRKRRNTRHKRSVVGSLEDILKGARENKENEIFISNEIDDSLNTPVRRPILMEIMQSKNEQTTPENKEVFTVYAISVDPTKEYPQAESTSTLKNEVIESVSTVPLDNKKENTGESEMSNEVDETTETFKVYEVFPTSKSEVTDKSSPLINDNNNSKTDSTTQVKNMNTETTTELRSETTSTMPPPPPPVSIMTSMRPRPPYRPEVITYPPLSNNGGGGIFDFLKRIVEFKYRLGLSILQSTSESLNRYLRSLDDTNSKRSE